MQLTGSIGEVLPFRLSLGYTNQQGILRTSDYQRYTAALNLNPSLLNDHLTFNLNGKFMWARNRYADTGAVNAAVWMDPTQDPYSFTSSAYNPFFEDPNNPTAEEIENSWIYRTTLNNFGGYFQWMANGASLNDSFWPYTRNGLATANPLAMLELRNDRAVSRSFTGNVDVDYKVHGFEDLRAHATLGADLAKGKQWTTNDPSSSQSMYYGWNGWSRQIKRAYTLSAYLQYYKDFNEKHHFDIMAGYEWQHFWHRDTSYGYGMYPFTNKDKALAGTKYNINSPRAYETENYLVSFFGRANYIYADRYYLTATVRHDGSSRFKKHWATFPSFALAWAINREDFLKDQSALSDLKLRLGWGKTGQQEGLGDYGWITTYSLSSSAGNDGSYYDVSGDGTLVRPNSYNYDLKWETTTTTNVGLDFGFDNQRVSGSIDWYYRKTTDLLNYAYTAAGTNPRNKMWQNIGSLRNTGVEFSISWKAISTGDWRWTLDYNFTYNSNKITELVGGDDEDYMVTTGDISSGTGLTCQAHSVGHPASSYYVYQQVYDQNGMPIEGVVVDRNADGQITPDDRYFYKSPMAPVTMGLASRLEWRNWDLGMNFRASLGNYVYNDLMAGASNLSVGEVFTSSNYLANRPTYVLPYQWQTYNQTSTLSDRWVQNGSFLKCDNITLGYSFSNLFASGNYTGVAGRVYATAANVFTITKYEGIDPEVSGGIDNSLYPRPFSFILGLSLNF